MNLLKEAAGEGGQTVSNPTGLEQVFDQFERKEAGIEILDYLTALDTFKKKIVTIVKTEEMAAKENASQGDGSETKKVSTPKDPNTTTPEVKPKNEPEKPEMVKAEAKASEYLETIIAKFKKNRQALIEEFETANLFVGKAMQENAK